jgi:cytochrome c551/c552
MNDSAFSVNGLSKPTTSAAAAAAMVVAKNAKLIFSRKSCLKHSLRVH